MRTSVSTIVVAALALAGAGGCSGHQSDVPVKQAKDAAVQQPAAEASPEGAPSPYDALPEAVRSVIDKPFTGDFDAMAKRRMIRVAVTFNRTHYFIDKGQQRGLTYESLTKFETDLNPPKTAPNAMVHVVFVPLQRDQLYPALINGKVDMVAAMIAVTPERETLVSFTEPTRTNVNEVVVTGPGAPPIATLDDLAGREVYVRKGSLYADSLVKLNADLKARGKAPVVINPAPAVFEDDDLLEMVNAGLVPITIVDQYLADFWSKIFTGLTVHPDVAVRKGGVLAVAVRKENPKLREVLNVWIKKNADSAFRGTVEQRYLKSVKYAKNSTSAAERKRFMDVVGLFKKYGDQYNLDYLLMAAQGFQESGLDQTARNPTGATGVMQVLPSTAKDLKVGDITELEPNIHAGVKYMRFMIDQYYANEPMDNLNKGLMAFAAYNAGPGRIRGLRREAEKRGLNPNVWFGNVERIASERIGRETVQYVGNIYKYYVAYRLVVEQNQRKMKAKSAIKK